jgi:hypothetical protein
MRLLRELPTLRLVVVGTLNLDHFAGLAPFAARVERRPLVDWRDLPAEIGRVDINLLPLELHPFNEAKSDLKYYEAGVLKIPTVASPTRALTESITHGENGFLASTETEWYAALKRLIVDDELRRWVGEMAYQHVMKTYVPEAIAREATGAYREIIRQQRLQRGFTADALSAVFVLELDGDPRAAAVVFRVVDDLARHGDAVTVLVSDSRRFDSAAQVEQFIAEHFFEPRFAVQLGGEIPCCDVLIATDSRTAYVVKDHAHRAHRTAYFVQDYEIATVTTKQQRINAHRALTLGLQAITLGRPLAEALRRRRNLIAKVLPVGLHGAGRALQVVLRRLVDEADAIAISGDLEAA